MHAASISAASLQWFTVSTFHDGSRAYLPVNLGQEPATEIEESYLSLPEDSPPLRAASIAAVVLQ